MLRFDASISKALPASSKGQGKARTSTDADASPTRAYAATYTKEKYLA